MTSEETARNVPNRFARVPNRALADAESKASATLASV